MLTRETQVVRFAVVRYHGDSNPKIEHAILNTARAQESSHGCQARLRRFGKFRHALIQTHLSLATKPSYMRGRVGCPSDTRPLKTNSNAHLR